MLQQPMNHLCYDHVLLCNTCVTEVGKVNMSGRVESKKLNELPLKPKKA